jgi:hypothetical protein
LQSLSLNSGSTPWATPPALCSEGFFGDRVSWPWLALKRDPPDLSFWVARITGMIHWHTAGSYILMMGKWVIDFEKIIWQRSQLHSV